MTRTQNTIIWIGLILVLVYLFTDLTFRRAIFGRSGAVSSADINTDSFLLDSLSGLPVTSNVPHAMPSNVKMTTQKLGGHT